MTDKNDRIVYWEFLPYSEIRKLNKNQRVIGTQILQVEGEKQHDVIIIIEETDVDGYWKDVIK